MSHTSTDILIVSLGSTAGLRASDQELAQSLQNCGVKVEIVSCIQPRSVRTLMLTDLLWAQAARRAAQQGVAQFQPKHILYSSTTAALFWPKRGIIRYDSPSVENRPGRHGLWQRPLECRRLRQATLLLPCSEAALARTPKPHATAVVLPIPVESSGLHTTKRDIAAITYAANPEKKGLERILTAWQQVRKPDEELVVAGVELKLSLPGVSVVGKLPRTEYRALLRRSRLYIAAPKREDHGIAQLEALADGCLLVTTHSSGPYVALAIAKQLDNRLVGGNLAKAIRIGLDNPSHRYTEQAKHFLKPLSTSAIEQTIWREVVPRLLPKEQSL